MTAKNASEITIITKSLRSEAGENGERGEINDARMEKTKEMRKNEESARTQIEILSNAQTKHIK